MSDKMWVDEAWRLPDDLVDRLQKSDYKDAWKWEIERTAQVRAILTDLIAELRDAPHPSEYRGNYANDCADRAEARLLDTGD